MQAAAPVSLLQPVHNCGWVIDPALPNDHRLGLNVSTAGANIRRNTAPDNCSGSLDGSATKREWSIYLTGRW